jgi:acyl carrier protein
MDIASHVNEAIKSFVLTEFLSGEDPAQLTDSTPLITTGILDSVAILKLVLFLEEHFSVTIEPHETDAEHMDTIERIAELVRSKG